MSSAAMELDDTEDRVVILKVMPSISTDIANVSNVTSGSGSSLAVLLASSPVTDLSLTGRLCVGASLVPQEPILESLLKPS